MEVHFQISCIPFILPILQQKVGESTWFYIQILSGRKDFIELPPSNPYCLPFLFEELCLYAADHCGGALMCQCLSQRRDKCDLDYLQKWQRDVKYNLDDTVVKYSVSRGFCVTWCY